MKDRKMEDGKMKPDVIKQVMVVAAVFAFSVPALSADAKKAASDALKKEIAGHRAMAEAHSNAAACLESGKPEKQCEEQLQKDCKGLGIGKHCGMKHSH
jgi:hypothetical protein